VVRVRVRRVLAISAIAVVVLVVTTLLVIHTNVVQSRVLQWSVAELERRFDLDLSAADLHYNLASRRVQLDHVRLAAKGHHDNPFFTADRVTVQLPWVIFRGMLRFDEINVNNGRVTITRDRQGVSNLPPGRGRRDPTAPPRRIDARSVIVNHLDFLYHDYQRDVQIQTPGVKLDLVYAAGDGAKGPFAFTGPTQIRIKERAVRIDPVQGVMTFDGSGLALAGVGLKTTEGAFTLDGAIARVLDAPDLDLRFAGTTDLARAAHWTDPPVHLEGAAAIDATMTGAPSQFVLDTTVRAANAGVGDERGVGIDAAARLTLNGLTVSRSKITPRTGGHVQATVDVPFGANTPWWIKANYTNIDAATAFRLAEVDPLPFGAALSGTAVIDRDPGEPFRLEVHNTSAPRTARGTAPLDGELEFVIEGDRWRADQRHRMGSTTVEGPIGGRWNRAAPSRSTFEGNLAVRTGNVGEAAAYAALFGLSTPALVRDSRGPLDAAVRIAGEFTSPQFIGTATSAGVVIPTIGATAFSADFDASERALGVTNLSASVGSSRITGEVLANFVNRRLSGDLKLDAPSVADLLATVPENVRLQGPITAHAVLSGTVDAPIVTADVAGNGLMLGGQAIDSLAAKARLVDDDLQIEHVTLRQAGGGELRATGSYDLATRAYTIDATGQELMWRGTLARLGDAEARFSLKFVGAGSVDRPAGEGAIEFVLTGGGVAGDLIDRGVMNVRLNGDTALVTGHIPSLGAFITGSIETRQPFAYDAVVVMNDISLNPFITLAGLRPGHVTGTASLSATATGALSAIADSRVFVNFQELDADASGVPVRLVTPARVAWDGDTLTVDALDVTVGQGRLLASGRLGEGGVASWESTFKGELGDLLKIGRPFGIPAELEGFGPVNIAWRSSGGLEQSTATVQLAGGSLGWGALPAVRDLTLDANFNGKTLDVTRLTGKWQDGGIDGIASIPRAVLEAREGGPPLPADQAGFAKLRVIGLTEEALSPWLGPNVLSAIDGRVSATLDARITRASIDGVAGNLTVDEAEFLIAGVPVSRVRPLLFSIRGGVVTADDVAINAGGSPLTLTGTARLAPADKQTIDMDLRGTADLQILSAFAPTIATDGDAKISVGIGGELTRPVFNGRIDVANGEVAIREPRIVIAELAGTIAFDGHRVLFDSLRGVANGGNLLVDGGFLLEGYRPTTGGVTVQLERGALEYPEGLQTEASALVTLRPSPTGWSLAGDVLVERSVYNETLSLPALLAARRSRAPTAASAATWTEDLRLNLFVVTQQDLVLDNNYGRLEAGAAVRVIGTAADPILAGRITLREGGEVYLGGNTFHVSRGSISFANPSRIVPEFDIELRTLVSGSDILLTLEGPLDRLETEVRSSDPGVDSRQAMSMLFGGFQGEDAIALLSAELLGATGRAIGLDTLRVERGFDNDEFRADPGLIANETDPSTRLTLSKRLRPDVELILSQSLRESGGLTAVVSYRPRRNIEIRGASRDNLDRSIALRHEITFGGADTAAALAASASRQPEVSRVTISGEPQRPVDTLVARLQLDPGDTFDFHQWQRDIDALREFYHDQQHYEVRVRGTREVSEDGRTVALDYAITPGPVAELVVVGHPLESGLQEEIREAWMRTIFDRFLLEDIRTRIARHLMDEDIIGSRIEAVVAASTPERKQIRVTVEAGTTVSARDVRYTGNAAVGESDLDRAVADAGLEVDGWLDPPRVAEALAAYYRTQGYLSVSVKADQPAVVGGVGVLPVTVEEGARYLIGALTFPGVSPARLLEVAGTARIDSGVPYVTEEIDAARERVEAMYARAGFNTAQIEVNAEPNPDAGSVELEFAIREGPQQVLREVATEGATRTDADVIRRALRLREGAPINLADWSQARKRLYDTNVFRQVDIEPVPMEPTTEESAKGIQPVRAVVRVLEYPVWRLRYGLQGNDEKTEIFDPDGDDRLQSVGVLADLQNQNLFGRAITAGIAGRYERDRQAASLFTSNSTFFGLPIRSSGFLFYSRQRFVASEELQTIDRRVGLTYEQRWRPFRTSEVLWSYRFERSRTFDPDPAPDDIFPFDITVKVSRFNVGMFMDRRDDPSDPKTGWFGAANYEQAIESLGSDYGNAKALLQTSAYEGLGRLVFAGRVQYGTAFGGQSLILSERFLLGGATTVRGYRENELGPRDVLGLPAGGDALLALNGEVRFPVRGWVQGVGFIDAGNVFATRGDVSFRDLAVGYGIGLRLASPFAMLRVDFGIPATTLVPERPANQFKSGRWYFGIGHIF
jgi:outer membrane protein insertion porin family